MDGKKIILTEEEIAVIERFLKGGITKYDATDEEQDIILKITDDAQDLCEELNAYEEVEDSFIEWYYNKYKSQAAQ